MFGKLFYQNGEKYRYDGLNHQFPIDSMLGKVWVEKGSNAYSQRDKKKLYACCYGEKLPMAWGVPKQPDKLQKSILSHMQEKPNI